MDPEDLLDTALRKAAEDIIETSHVDISEKFMAGGMINLKVDDLNFEKEYFIACDFSIQNYFLRLFPEKLVYNLAGGYIKQVFGSQLFLNDFISITNNIIHQKNLMPALLECSKIESLKEYSQEVSKVMKGANFKQIQPDNEFVWIGDLVKPELFMNWLLDRLKNDTILKELEILVTEEKVLRIHQETENSFTEFIEKIDYLKKAVKFSIGMKFVFDWKKIEEANIVPVLNVEVQNKGDIQRPFSLSTWTEIFEN